MLEHRTPAPVYKAIVCALAVAMHAGCSQQQLPPAGVLLRNAAPRAQVLYVTSTADGGPGSLRNTVASAVSGDVIEFSLPSPSTIALTSGGISITKNLTIDGPGSSQLTIDGGNKFRLFLISTGSIAALSGMTLTKGQGAGGGAIWNAGSLQVDHIEFIANATIADVTHNLGDGGAIADAGKHGSLTVTNSVFKSNKTAPRTNNFVDSGGAIWSASGYSVSISHTTFRSNSASTGGAIAASGPVRLDTVDFTGNAALDPWGSRGGALFLQAASTILTSTFSGNAAPGSGWGGAIYTTADATVSSSTFTGNSAGTPSATEAFSHAGFGGAIYTAQGVKLQITADSFTANTGESASAGFGGAIDAGSVIGSKDTFISNQVYASAAHASASAGGGAIAGNIVQLSDSTFETNSAAHRGLIGSSSNGGAILATDVVLLRVTITKNTAAANSTAGAAPAGAVAAVKVNVSDSTISQNTGSTYSGEGGAGLNASNGGSVVRTTFASNVSSADGGAIASGGMLTVSQCTFVGNRGANGGAIDNLGTVAIVNSTFNANGATAKGGAVSNPATKALSVLNVTLYGNTAATAGGNVENAGSMTIANSIVGEGTSPQGADIDNIGTVTSADYNLIESSINGFTPASHDRYSAGSGAAQLLSLASNGGPTQTMADQATSPGYNAIPLASCTTATPPVAIDQRGLPRGDGGDGVCDIGAYEYQVTSAP